MAKQTANVELVETHALTLALKRLDDGSKNGMDMWRWKRAIYHAIAMSRVADHSTLKAIREALNLP